MGNVINKCCSTNCLRIVVVGNPKRAKDFYSKITKKEVTHETNYHYEDKTTIVGKDVSLVLPLTTQLVWPDQIISADGFIFMCEDSAASYLAFQKTFHYDYSKIPKIIVADRIDGSDKPDKRSIIVAYSDEQIVDKEHLEWLFNEIKSNKYSV